MTHYIYYFSYKGNTDNLTPTAKNLFLNYTLKYAHLSMESELHKAIAPCLKRDPLTVGDIIVSINDRTNDNKVYKVVAANKHGRTTSPIKCCLFAYDDVSEDILSLLPESRERFVHYYRYTHNER